MKTPNMDILKKLLHKFCKMLINLFVSYILEAISIKLFSVSYDYF